MKKIKRFVCVIMAALLLVTAPAISYMDAYAADAVLRLGGVALKDIMIDCLIAAGITAIGGVTIHELKKNDSAMDSLKSSLLSSPCLDAINDIEKYKEEHANDPVFDCNYSSLAGYDIGFSSGKIQLTLSPDLIMGARSAVKAWADSGENIVDAPAGADKAGTEPVNSQYMSSIVTTVKSIPAIDSMADMDAMFGVDGACSYFKSRGYSDTAYYWLVEVNGSYNYFMPVPYGYSVVGFRTSWLGCEDKFIISNADYKNSIVQNGVRDASSFFNYFYALPKYTGRYYRYDVSSSEWSEYEGNHLPWGSQSEGFRLSNWYTCGYKGSYSGGSLISWNNYSSILKRILYTFDSVGKFFTYDYSKAPSIPDDGIGFKIPESDYDGFGDRDLADLISYITSLSDELRKMLEDQEKNQEEIIQQGKDTLEAINNMHATIGKISAAVGDLTSTLGKVLASVLSIGKAMKTLPGEIADALGEIVLPGLDELTDVVITLPGNIVGDLTDALPDIISDAVASVFPRVDEVEDAVIAFPDAIAHVLESIVIEPNVNVELNPAYNITVENDFTGLSGIISGAVESVLTKCFVPDEAATLEKFSEMEDFFRFKDDIIAAIGDLKTMLFGITPSPILKIPVGKPTSKKYNYGTGSYIIIDVSWYAQYKQLGDKIVLAIAWALFLWRMFIKLPGIISGTEGTIVAADRAHNRYEYTKSMRKD